MKTIEVSDEIHQRLMELSTEINAQPNRGTAMPYIFQVKERKKKYHSDDPDGYTYLTPDYDEIGETRKQLVQSLRDHGIKVKNSLSLDEIEEIAIAEGFYKVGWEWQEEFSNAFLTGKACQEHIQANGYHYKQPVTYLNFAFRNPELELVFQFLCELTGGKLIK